MDHDHGVLTDALTNQIVGEPVGPALQLGVADPRVAVHHRGSVWLRRGTGSEQFVNTLLPTDLHGWVPAGFENFDYRNGTHVSGFDSTTKVSDP